MEYDTTKHHCTNSNSITGTKISWSQSPTCVPALDDKEIASNCSAWALLVETVNKKRKRPPNKNCTNLNSITGTKIYGSRSLTCMSVLDDKEIASNCSAWALLVETVNKKRKRPPNKNCTNLNSITGTKIYGSRSLTCMSVLDDKEVAGNCSAQALLVETVKKRKRKR